MSKNELRIFDELIHLPYLQNVNVSQNKIKDFRFLKENREALAFLQKLDMSQNEIRELTDMP